MDKSYQIDQGIDVSGLFASMNATIDDKLQLLNLTQKILPYENGLIIGSGAFGVVYKAKSKDSGNVVAIKKVLQDKRFKNRELEIMKELNHPNIVQLKNHFLLYGDTPETLYLNYVMDYVPDTLSRIIRHHYVTMKDMSMLYVKVISFQMIKALAYIHSLGICHRDIKPQNFLIDPSTNEVKLCDFGSAKKIIANQANIAYICSRYYRAPELIFGATEYTNHIDIWSVGCIIAEMLLGNPIFAGESSSDQLIEIIKVLGTPTKTQIAQMNPSYKDNKFPFIQPIVWKNVFKDKTVSDEYIDLVSKLLLYDPKSRLTPMRALCHPFFNELRSKIPNGSINENSASSVTIPPYLLTFTEEEIQSDQESAQFLMKSNII